MGYDSFTKLKVSIRKEKPPDDKILPAVFIKIMMRLA